MDPTDECPSKERSRPSDIPFASTDGGAGIWDHQAGDGLPAVHAQRLGESEWRMAAGVLGVQLQTLASIDAIDVKSVIGTVPVFFG